MPEKKGKLFLTLKRLGYFEGLKNWGGGGRVSSTPHDIPAVDCPIATKFGMCILGGKLYANFAKIMQIY